MIVVHIGYKYGQNNTGGAAIAATRLHKMLLACGIESHYVCIWQCEDGENVHVLPRIGSVARRLYFFATRSLRGFWKFTHWRRSIPMNIIPLFGLEKLLNQIRPDIVHVHWINADVMSFEQLAKIRCKVVLNLHDLFMINAIDAYPGSDQRYINGLTRENSSFIERWLFGRKFRLVHKIKPVFVGPSKWVCDCVKKSFIGKSCRAYAIPNIIDLAYRYSPEARLPHDKFIVLFGAYGGRRNPSKGFIDLEKALSLLPDGIKEKFELWVFGEEAQDCEIGGVNAKFLGNVSSTPDLARLYNTADVFAFPSVQETQGMTKIEAMMCGLPVVAFDRTACAEGIEDGVSGWVVKDANIKGFAESLTKQFEIATSCLDKDEIHRLVAQRSKELVSAVAIQESMLRVYRTLS